MAQRPFRISLTALDTIEIDPADPAGSWRRNSLTPRTQEPDVELELVSGCDGEVAHGKVAIGLGDGWASLRVLRVARGIWAHGAPMVIRRGVPTGVDQAELELELNLSDALEEDARAAPAYVRPRGRVQRRAASEAYIGRLPGLYADWLELEPMSPAADVVGPAGGEGTERPLRRAVMGSLGPPIPRSRRGRMREIDPDEVERMRRDERRTNWEIADRLRVESGSPAKATYRARKRRRQLRRGLDR